MSHSIKLIFGFDKNDPLLEEYSAFSLLLSDVGSYDPDTKQKMIKLNKLIADSGKGAEWKITLERLDQHANNSL